MADSKKELSTLDQLAIMMVQTQQVWQLASDNDWPENLRAIHSSLDKKKEEFAAKHWPKEMSIIGSLPIDDDRSHYDIDDQIDQVFSNTEVNSDSESGMFCVYVVEDKVEEVTTWLKKYWPALQFKVHDNDQAATPFCNSTAAESHVKENNIEVDPIIGQEIFDKIASYDQQIKLLEGEKELYVKSISV
jgi:uncharacterized protein YlzI (FlbEa/FlbD family)